MNPEPLSHERVDALLPAWLDAELPPAEEQEVEQHLQGCPDCRARYEKLADAVALVRSVPRARPTADFTRRVVKRARRNRRREFGLAGTHALFVQRFPVEAIAPILLAVAAAALLLLLWG